MYLVELRPGKEELYRNGDELAAAIRSGDVDGHSRIYHRATSKWISITLHPQFKAILADKTTPASAPADFSTWTYLTAQSDALGEPDPAPSHSDPQAPAEPATGEGHHPWRRPLALSITGLFLVLGVQLASSGPRPPWSSRTDAVTGSRPGQSQPAAAPTAATPNMVSLASSTSWGGEDEAWRDDEYDNDSAATPPKTVALPKAPSLKLAALESALPGAAGAPAESDALTVEGLLSRQAAAFEAARERMITGLRVARLSQLFAATRLTPDGGVTEARLGLAGASNFIRVYRQQETLIEKQFQDSFTVMSKQNGWPAKAVRRWNSKDGLKESPTLASLTGVLVNRIDSVLGVLSAQAGAYAITGGKITFEDPAAARTYGVLRQQIASTMDAAIAAGGTESSGPMGQLLQAIGTTRLPRES
ncbi:MAG: hypothetical protein H0T44_15280 [Gemmatimonadales bacterium]|nr:hypothetical protein [Gemmatimonadales bacterium]